MMYYGLAKLQRFVHLCTMPGAFSSMFAAGKKKHPYTMPDGFNSLIFQNSRSFMLPLCFSF